MNEPVYLVTGATDGIGRQTALELLRTGGRVLVHGRSMQKAEKVTAELARESGKPAAESVHGDLSSFAEVRALAEHVLKLHPVVDVLVNNAGVFMNDRQVTVDGHEVTFQVNHLSPFLLTHLLLPALKKSTQGRVVNVSSVAHQRGRIDFEDLDSGQSFDGYAAYANSKLANILFTGELSRRLAGTAVTANSLHPGVVTTKLLATGFNSTGASLEEGARTSVKLATDASLAKVTGQYFASGRAVEPAAQARDAAVAKKLFEVSARMTGASA